MRMVGGLDLHRRQITFDVVGVESGRDRGGVALWQPDRERFRRWLATRSRARAHGGSVALAVEGCTGWRYVVEEISAAGFEPHPRRAGRHPSGAGPQAPRQDRPHRCPAAARAARTRGAARELDPARRRVGVARTRPAVQVAGRPAHDCGANGSTPSSISTGSRSQRARSAPRRPGSMLADGNAADLAGPVASGSTSAIEMIDAADTRGLALEMRTAAFRDAPAGVSGAGRCAVRDRRAARGGGVVRARRLPALHSLRAGGASHRPRRDRRLHRTVDAPAATSHARAPRRLRWALYEAAKNSSHRRSPDHDYYATGQRASRRQDRRDLRRPPVRPTLLSRAARRRSRRGLRHPRLSISPAGSDGARRPPEHQGLSGQLPPPACPPALVLDGLRTLTRPRSHPGVTRSRLLSPTTRGRRAPR